MLRFKVLVSAVPLIAAAFLARLELFSNPKPCIAVGEQTVELTDASWHADLHVSFTDDPRLATVRVAVTEDAGSADFTVIDDAAADDGGACGSASTARLVAIDRTASGPSAPVIYLSDDEGAADYRIFVRSKRFTARDAAALIVGSHDQHLALNAS
ncbi:MAG: hypothetical protein JOY90_11505 [Bradyrhizobium sp.]|uniref:hypothetical protein n=1 Tax=Bradyrhizobium sp. TaxID=376 RepID=UPI001D41D12C|nr:hypothetical protein [Bradyrhizobium sp.]MBV9561068.1 hypothetical protein [Bradyrhizobium sp.]